MVVVSILQMDDYFTENPIEMDDLGVPLFWETPIWGHAQKV